MGTTLQKTKDNIENLSKIFTKEIYEKYQKNT